MTTFDDKSLAAFRCAMLLLSVVFVGTIGFWLIEDQWNLWDALYFTLITVTTVGYSDGGISEAGQRFALVLLLCGIGTFTYSLSTLVQFAADREAALLRRMKRKIKETRDHVVVCGYGRMGRTACQQLTEGGITCVVIEASDDNFRRAVGDGHLVVQGAASNDDVLVQAGVLRASGVVCAVDSDAENMFITVSVRDLNANCKIVSRAESEGAARKLERAGATLVISPHQMAGQSIANAMLHPCLNRFMQHSLDGEYLLLSETEISAESGLTGRTVHDLGQLSENVAFVAIQRADGQQIMGPRDSEKLLEGDVVILAGRSDDLDALHRATHMAVGV